MSVFARTIDTGLMIIPYGPNHIASCIHIWVPFPDAPWTPTTHFRSCGMILLRRILLLSTMAVLWMGWESWMSPSLTQGSNHSWNRYRSDLQPGPHQFPTTNQSRSSSLFSNERFTTHLYAFKPLSRHGIKSASHSPNCSATI